MKAYEVITHNLRHHKWGDVVFKHRTMDCYVSSGVNDNDATNALNGKIVENTSEWFKEISVDSASVVKELQDLRLEIKRATYKDKDYPVEMLINILIEHYKN